MNTQRLLAAVALSLVAAAGVTSALRLIQNSA